MSGYWTIPRLWDGDICVILGGGPSLKSLDLSLLKGKRVIAVNCAYRLGAFDACFFGDGAFVERYAPRLLSWPGLVVTRRDEYLDSQVIKVVRQKTEMRPGNDLPFDVEGISQDPNYLCWNRSSGGCAVNLATLLGAGKIVLCGYDMQTAAGQHNWHDLYPDNDVQAHVDNYDKFIRPFDAIARDLAALNIDCVNATPGSALRAFPITTPEEALC